MKNVIFKITLFCMLLLNCSSDSEDESPQINDQFYYPPISANNWETNTPENLNWNTNEISNLNSFLENSGTKAFMILVNGRIVIESYFNGFTAEDNHTWNSASKTLTAFTFGIAEQENYISINDKTSDYLGIGWTNMPTEKENLITLKHQLTMTSGGNYNFGNWHCTDSNCLNYLTDAGNEWFYYNAFYTLIQPALNAAIPQGVDSYFNQKLRLAIGMQGWWFETGFNKTYGSNARSMARFGLLCLKNGFWEDNQLINSAFFSDMINTSQTENPSYGYLWWLNGKSGYKVPGSTEFFNNWLIPNAPEDMYAGLGANDQKLYIIPSKNMVIVRLGDDGGEGTLGPSGYDISLWEAINNVIEQ